MFAPAKEYLCTSYTYCLQNGKDMLPYRTVLQYYSISVYHFEIAIEVYYIYYILYI